MCELYGMWIISQCKLLLKGGWFFERQRSDYRESHALSFNIAKEEGILQVQRWDLSSLCARKTTQFSPPVALSCVFPLLLTPNTSLLTLPMTKYVGGFPHTWLVLFSTTAEHPTISLNSLPGDSVRSHRLKAQSHPQDCCHPTSDADCK